jgi:DNA-binding transcriptional ArsR family regulator
VSTYGAAAGTAVLDALADPTRRAVLDLVRQRPRSVTELAAELPVSRPAVSQHLRALKTARLVTDRAEGTRRIYSLDPQGLAELRDFVDRLWRAAMTSFVEYAEQTYVDGSPTDGGIP